MPSTPKSERILEVNDEEAVRELVACMLTSAGYRYKTAADGLEALALLDSGEEFDLLLCNLMMPNLNGMELLERTKGRFPDMPFVLETGTHDISRNLALCSLFDVEFPLCTEPQIVIQPTGVGVDSLRSAEQFPLDLDPAPGMVVLCDSWIQVPANLVQIGSLRAEPKVRRSEPYLPRYPEKRLNIQPTHREESRHSGSSCRLGVTPMTGRRKPVEPPRQKVIPDNYYSAVARGVLNSCTKNSQQAEALLNE